MLISNARKKTICIVPERAKRVTVRGEEGSSNDGSSKRDEEEWPLKEVVFLEDVKSVPLGRVLKVDGAYAAVRFPTVGKDGKEIVPTNPDDWMSLLQDCRLVRKDDLVAVKWGAGGAAGPRGPDCLQRSPRKIALPPEVQVVTIAVSFLPKVLTHVEYQPQITYI